HMLADVKSDRPNQKPDEERDAPAPTLELVGCECAGQYDAERRSQHRREALAEPLETGKKAFARAGVLDEERRRAAKFTRNREPLEESRNERGNRRRYPDRRVG